MELRPSRPISLEEHLVGGTKFSGLKLTPSCSLSLSLSLCLEIVRFFENWSYSNKSSQPLTSRPSLKIEPTSRQISEETLENLKLREKNFEHQTTPSNQSSNNRMTSRNATTRGVSSQETKRQISDHFNLKASNQTKSLFC